MSDMTIGFAITGSFCTFKAVFPQMNLLVEHGYHVLPIMSENVYTTDTRFGRAADWVAQAEEVCGEKVIHTIAQAEPIGPKKLLDLFSRHARAIRWASRPAAYTIPRRRWR